MIHRTAPAASFSPSLVLNTNPVKKFRFFPGYRRNMVGTLREIRVPIDACCLKQGLHKCPLDPASADPENPAGGYDIRGGFSIDGLFRKPAEASPPSTPCGRGIHRHDPVAVRSPVGQGFLFEIGKLQGGVALFFPVFPPSRNARLKSCIPASWNHYTIEFLRSGC